MLRGLKTFFNGIGLVANRGFDVATSLVPLFLQNILWLINTAYFTLAKKAYGQNAIVFACLRLLCQAVPEPPLVIHKRKPNADPERFPVADDHPLQQLIDRPNELLTQYQFWQLVTLHTGIAGRSHWWKERDMVGNTTALWPLRPDRVAPIYASKENDQPGSRVLWGWSYQVPGTGHYEPIERRDVMTFHFPDPAGESGGMVEGLGPLQALAAEISADNAATHYVGTIIANAATPNLVIKTAGKIRDRETAQRLKEQFMREFAGDNLGRPGVLDADASIERIAFSMRDLTFPDVRNVAESRIAAAFGVPALLVGLKVGIDSSIRATTAELREYFAETTLSNLWRQFSDTWNRDITDEFDPGLICLFDHTKVRALAIQTRTEKEPLEVAFQRGSITMNEYRVKVLNLPEVPEGDVYFVPNGVTVVVAANLDKEEPPPTIPLPPRQQGDFGTPERMIAEGPRETTALPEPTPGTNGTNGMAKRAEVVGAANGSGTHDVALATKPLPLTDWLKGRRAAARDQHAAALTELRDQHTEALVPKLARELASLKERIIERLREANHEGTAAKSVHGMGQVVTVEDQKVLTELLEDHYAAVFTDVYADTGDRLGIALEFNVANPKVAAIIRQRVGFSVGKMDDTMRTYVQDLINRANEEGLSVADVAARIHQDQGATFSVAQARTVARTETAVAMNAASTQSYRDSGMVDQVQVIDGEDYDDACAQANGQVWTLDEADANPIEHPNCRRVFVPIVKDEESG